MSNDRPNIVFIFSDQHRGDALGSVGNTAVRTPNLDGLAAEGVVFRNCSTSSPLCMPARASLVTGQYVNEHGAWGNRNEADRHGQSHVKNIRDAGYCTAVFGKTHFKVPQADAGHTRESAFELNDWGYEVAHEILGEPTSGSYYDDFLAKRKKLQIHETAMSTWKMGQGNSTLRPWEHTPCLLEENEHIDAYITNTANEWIAQYTDERPFYLQVALVGPHPPFDAPARYRDMFDPKDMPPAIMEPPAEPVSPQVKTMFKRRGLANMTEGQSRLMTSHYYAKVAFDDNLIGSVIETLTGKGLMDNTWIIYTSDHGEMLGDHRMVQKAVFYEGALNIPLIIRPPGGTEPWIANGLTDHYDIVNTMLDVTSGAPLEDDHGVSLISKIEAGKDAANAQQGKDVIFSEVRLYSMARTERYKMTIDSVTREPLDLYDMGNDPDELRNLVNEPSLSSVRDQMLEEHFEKLLNNINKAQLEFAQAGGIATAIHEDYPAY
jgi:arylsulfatase